MNKEDLSKSYHKTKAKTAQLLEERPLETIVVASAAVGAAAKLIHSVTEARNAAVWKREVRRREEKQRGTYNG